MEFTIQILNMFTGRFQSLLASSVNSSFGEVTKSEVRIGEKQSHAIRRNIFQVTFLELKFYWNQSLQS